MSHESTYQGRGHRFYPCSRKIAHAEGQLSPSITTADARLL